MRILVALLSLHLALSLGFVLVTAAFLALLRGERLRAHREALGWLTREWLGTALVILIRPLGTWMRPPFAAAGAPREPEDLPPAAAMAPPVIMVPGYGMNRSCFTFLAAWLRRRGWRWVWGINNQPVSRPVPVYAANLAQRVEELCQASGAAEVDIVAHSMGGLIAAWYVGHLGGQRRVRRLVTLGTPWQGSRIAVFGRQRESMDLLPGSEIVTRLGPPTVPTTCIWSRGDTIVLPPEHALRPGARHHELPWVGHLSLLLSARAYRLVAQALSSSPADFGPADTLPTPADLDSVPTAGEQGGAQEDRDADLRTSPSP